MTELFIVLMLMWLIFLTALVIAQRFRIDEMEVMIRELFYAQDTPRCYHREGDRRR